MSDGDMCYRGKKKTGMGIKTGIKLAILHGDQGRHHKERCD